MNTISSPITITLSQWLEAGLTYNNYQDDKKRAFLRSSRACKGQEVLIEWNSIPEKRKAILRATIGDPVPKQASILASVIEPDPEAYTFFSTHRLTDGSTLNPRILMEYCANAAVLKTVGRLVLEQRTAGNSRTKEAWEKLTRSVENLDKSVWPHTLPTNPRRLREKYHLLAKEGYQSLIHRGFCNQNKRKVFSQTESLVMALFTTDNRHFVKTTQELFLQWLGGAFEIANIETGELFNREDFFDKKGNPIHISESTARNILRKISNQQAILKFRESAFKYTNKALPHNHRHKPNYSLSMISMDDFRAVLLCSQL